MHILSVIVIFETGQRQGKAKAFFLSVRFCMSVCTMLWKCVCMVYNIGKKSDECMELTGLE